MTALAWCFLGCFLGAMTREFLSAAVVVLRRRAIAQVVEVVGFEPSAPAAPPPPADAFVEAQRV